MALWQFTTFTVLIAVLIVYAIFITRRLGLADARMTRMEEALLFLARSGSVNAGSAVRADTPVVDADPVFSEVFEEPAASAVAAELPQISANPQVSAQEEARRVYLTMRDLRARSEQRATVVTSTVATVPPDAEADLETREALQTAPEPTPMHAAESASLAVHDAPTRSSEPAPTALARSDSVDALPRAPEPTPAREPEVIPEAADTVGTDGVVPTHSAAPQSQPLDDVARATHELTDTAHAESASADAHDVPTTRSEPAEALSETAAATILEIGDAPVTNTESQNSAKPDHRPPDDDISVDDDDDAAASKKNQEILVFLNAQRRRRRAHLGY